VLIGVTQLGDQVRAWLVDLDTQQRDTVGVGDSAFGFAVKQVGAESVVLTRGGRDFVLRLGQKPTVTGAVPSVQPQALSANGGQAPVPDVSAREVAPVRRARRFAIRARSTPNDAPVPREAAIPGSEMPGEAISESEQPRFLNPQAIRPGFAGPTGLPEMPGVGYPYYPGSISGMAPYAYGTPNGFEPPYGYETPYGYESPYGPQGYPEPPAGTYPYGYPGVSPSLVGTPLMGPPAGMVTTPAGPPPRAINPQTARRRSGLSFGADTPGAGSFTNLQTLRRRRLPVGSGPNPLPGSVYPPFGQPPAGR
jgi:hypothetical protein